MTVELTDAERESLEKWLRLADEVPLARAGIEREFVRETERIIASRLSAAIGQTLVNAARWATIKPEEVTGAHNPMWAIGYTDGLHHAGKRILANLDANGDGQV